MKFSENRTSSIILDYIIIPIIIFVIVTLLVMLKGDHMTNYDTTRHWAKCYMCQFIGFYKNSENMRYGIILHHFERIGQTWLSGGKCPAL